MVVATAYKVESTWLYGMLSDVGYFDSGMSHLAKEPENFQEINEACSLSEFVTLLKKWYLMGNAFPLRADEESCSYDQETLGGSHQLEALSD